MTEDAMRAMHQEGLARQNVELQHELAQSRQQAAPLRGTQSTGVGADTRLLESDFSVFKGHAGVYHVCRS